MQEFSEYVDDVAAESIEQNLPNGPSDSVEEDTLSPSFKDSHSNHGSAPPPIEDRGPNKHKLRQLKKTRFPRSSITPTLGESHHQGKGSETENDLREAFPGPVVSYKYSTTMSKSTTQNFTLSTRNGTTLLYHDKEKIINLTSPRKVHLSIRDTMTYEGGTVLVTAGITEAVHHPNIDMLTVYEGTEVYTLTPADRGAVYVGVSGELFLSENRGFYCLNQEFGTILNNELTRIASSNNSTPHVEFKGLADGKSILIINGMSIIILTDAELREVPSNQSLMYRDATLHFQQANSLEVFPEVEQFFLLNEPASAGGGIIQKCTQNLDGLIPGGGELYVHKATRIAFFSRDPFINLKVRSIYSSLSPFSNTTIDFSIKFEAYVNNGAVIVVILADRSEIMRLEPNQVLDQSIAPQHHFTYINNTVQILEGDHILDTIEGIRRITLHTNSKLTSHTFSLPEPVQGGGQLFACEGLGLYSQDATLNDKIGDAILAAEAQSSCYYLSSSLTPPGLP